MEHSLTSDEVKAIAQSVLLRCEYLAAMFGSDAPGTARTGLIGLNRAIHLLATRRLGDPVALYVLNADVRANRALSWYLTQYLPALADASQFVQRALAERLLTPRDLLSRTPFPHDALNDWTTRDIASAISAAACTFWASPPQSEYDSPAWPDYAARAPGVGIDQREISEWAASAGLESSLGNGAIEVADVGALAANPSNAAVSAASGDVPADHDVASMPANARSTPEMRGHRVEARRRDVLDPAIDKAIQAAESHDTAAVFLELRELALQQEKPFTGEVVGDALCYTDVKSTTAKFTKESLSKRLQRRIDAANGR